MSRHDSKQIENVKVMLIKGESGSSIASIEKTGTSELVDTYTVTLTDGTKTTFTVTNGKGIASINKTGTEGLIDTYTITFNDDTTATFTVTNGKSIVNIAKTDTTGSVDTYTITYNDNTTSTFQVTNSNLSDVWTVMNKMGAKNLLGFPYAQQNKEYNGISYIINYDDYSIICNGTATEESNIVLFNANRPISLKKGKYKIFQPSNVNAIFFRMYDYSTSPTSRLVDQNTDGSFELLTDHNDNIGLNIIVRKGFTVNNQVIKPLLVMQEYANDVYAPASMTNLQLTKMTRIMPLVGTYDMNDFKKQGCYYFDSNNVPLNAPNIVNGWIFVFDDGWNGLTKNVKQVVMRAGSSSNTHMTYVRTWFESISTWTPWVLFKTDADVETDVNIGILEIQNVTIPANGYANSDVTLSDFMTAGVIPFAVAGYSLDTISAQFLSIYRMEIDKSGSTFTLGYGIHNNTNSAVTLTLKVKIAYLRNHSITWSGTIS